MLLVARDSGSAIEFNSSMRIMGWNPYNHVVVSTRTPCRDKERPSAHSIVTNLSIDTKDLTGNGFAALIIGLYSFFLRIAY